MKKLFILSALSFAVNTFAQKVIISADKHGNTFEYVENDPNKTRVYTLDNGFKAYISQNKKQPRIQTYIAVRAGSANDPENNTGLAHYLEHMMFKGTSKIGTSNWGEEKPLLDKIAKLYEQHRAEQNPETKKNIYKKIDSISYEASKYAIANEYDNMISSIGAKYTNAYTSNDQTIYMNDIPANELERWMKIESERFSELVLRLFHTELESVYEEFNNYQGEDSELQSNMIHQLLFPNIPYGKQTIIGNPEHLKNPSMNAIKKYYDHYYVANNMAVVLVGDLDYDQSITWIKKYFGTLKRGNPPVHRSLSEASITKIKKAEVITPTEESLQLAYRLGGSGTKDVLIAKVIKKILLNDVAGLLDINVNQPKKVASVDTYIHPLKEHTLHWFEIVPNENQSLEEAQSIILKEIEKIKNGEFDDWLLSGAINKIKLEEEKYREDNTYFGSLLHEVFTYNLNLEDSIFETQAMAKISKNDIIEFAKRTYKDNYAVVYKKQGPHQNLVRVDNPPITPIALQNTHSSFYNSFVATKTKDIEPVFVNFEKVMHKETIQGSEFAFIKNNLNNLAEIRYVIEIGSNHNKKLSIALDYLKYLHTKNRSREDIKKEQFISGIGFSNSYTEKQTIFKINALQENSIKGIEIFGDLIQNALSDKETFDTYIQQLFNIRSKNKKDAQIIKNGLSNHTFYGKNNPITNVLSDAELKNLTHGELIAIIKDLFTYKQQILYYGNNVEKVKEGLIRYHAFGKKQPTLVANQYTLLESDNTVFFTPYDMVQADVYMGFSGPKFDKSLVPFAMIFQTYFGQGLSSVVFQEIREARSLAYNAYSVFATPNSVDQQHFVLNVIATQADKFGDAVATFKELLDHMPMNESKFQVAKQAVLKQIATSRYSDASTYDYWFKMKNWGLKNDLNKEIYETVKNMSLSDFSNFHKQYIKGKKMNYGIMGSKEHLDWKAIENLGNIKELTTEDLLGY